MDIPQVKNQDEAETGSMGQEYLVTGKSLAMRRWNEPSGDACESSAREYETVGYVIQGKIEITVDGEKATLTEGDSWLVPSGATHSYRIIEPLIAVEATSPPARFAGRDAI